MSEKNPKENECTWKMYMKTLKARKLVIDVEERLPGIIDDWYKEHGLDTPPWRNKKPYFDDDGNIIRPE